MSDCVATADPYPQKYAQYWVLVKYSCVSCRIERDQGNMLRYIRIN